MKEYKMAKGWAVFLFILGFGFIACLTFTGIFGYAEQHDIWMLVTLSILGLPFVIFMVISFIYAIRARVVIDDEKIRNRTAFTNHQLFFNEIKGYRLIISRGYKVFNSPSKVTIKGNGARSWILIEPIDEKKKRLKVSFYLRNSGEIVSWLVSNFPNLDLLDIPQETEAILKNDDFGGNTEERAAKLKNTLITTRILNITGALVFVMSVFAPPSLNPYLLTAAVVILAITILKVKTSKGLIKIDMKWNTAYPSISGSFIFTLLSVPVIGLSSFEFINFSNAWAPAALLTIAFAGIIFFRSKEFKIKQKTDFVKLPFLSLFIFGFCIGILIYMNCYFDNSQPEIYKAGILRKDKEEMFKEIKGSCHYEFTLTPWGGKQTKSEIEYVSKELFRSRHENDAVTVYYHKGLFNIPWYTVGR